ncbi:putative acyl transferase [Paenibacillus sp. 32O-W]|uniref:Colanic acid biosynthesis acetyltransferase WcaF n=1 Tax=Paenibacillus cisolokensis TaxID=1658519 RepID=A0ABQ4N5A6_9BACL|nr:MULTISPECIES: WcaF family extracellular polysaccharide biosynthesis acetyltransferase [Paenibacillus]ALS29709.1 putative acyl transferase [Paenibacillus sp. 32O-W]GIQ63390.1 colanic acid biosynthesis acetyltransferase WcaF [Paenibacillus cisolokensis]
MKNKIRLDQYDQSHYSRGRSGMVVLLWWFVQGTLFRFSLHPMYSWRNMLLRLFGASIGRGVKVRPTARFTYPWKVAIGDHSWIGDHVELYSLDRIEIGEHCVISQQSYICTGTHNIRDPRFGLVTRPVRIGDGAWVASGAFVYPGVTIGPMAVVAARSTVIRNVPANEVHAGSPAQYLQDRFAPVNPSEPRKEVLV